MKPFFAIRLLAALAMLSVAACSDMANMDLGLGDGSNLDQLRDAKAGGTAFQRAQFTDYAYLARSFGENVSGGQGRLANAYADKALTAAGGSDVSPEDSDTSEQKAMLGRLERALDAGRDRSPTDAARAQADYDCWVMNDAVEGQAAAARQCRNSLEETLPQLESEAGTASR